jgi:hypothetical protein
MGTRQLPVLERRGFGETLRRDAWWLPNIAPLIVFTAFLVYAPWAAFQNAHYEFGPYLSPLYSPLLFGDSPHAWFSAGVPAWWPSFVPWSPAWLILPFPALFRFTCYYYRGTYYKAFWADPPGCAVGEPRKNYRGERWFPLVLQNVHRFFLYFAIIFIFILTYDAWKGFWFADPSTGNTHFGIGVGSLLLVLNATLLGGYTFGCHAARHLVGGVLDQLSLSPVRRRFYAACSSLNAAHGQWAWASLIVVAFTDIYIRLCSMGIWTDLRIL